MDTSRKHRSRNLIIANDEMETFGLYGPRVEISRPI
jgi:hypothetical protein